MTRRGFVRAGAIATGTFMTSFSLPSNHNKIKLAILGTGNWGTEVLLKSAVASGYFDVVALCDVNTGALQRASAVAAALGKSEVKLFSDYTKMYEMKGLNTVAITGHACSTSASENVVQVDFPRVMTNVNSSIKSAIEAGEIGKLFQVTANINHQEGGVTERSFLLHSTSMLSADRHPYQNFFVKQAISQCGEVNTILVEVFCSIGGNPLHP